MAILFNEKTRVFTLQTDNSAYQMKVGPYGVLLHLFYGKRLGDMDLSGLIRRADRGFSGNPYDAGEDRTFSLDTLPLEYPCFGTGDYRTVCLEAVHADGSNAVDLRYAGHEIQKGKYSIKGLPALYENEGDKAWTLRLYMRDTASALKVELLYGVMENMDMITRSVRVTNEGQDAVVLKKVLSAGLDFLENDHDLIDFYGRHAMEREVERRPLRHGRHVIGSRRGASSHHYNPFLILCSQNASEDFGDCYGISLLYSGNFTGEAEADQLNQIRLVMGIQPEGFAWRLEPGEEFCAPEAALAYSDRGLGELSRIYHKAFRQNLCRGEYKEKRRPVLINSWEAAYFDFDGERLLKIAEEAKELGIEMLVMDDGWFGGRSDDSRGLGDWTVNEEKLGCSLKELADRVNGLGLKFGIWFEPEMVSEDSRLYREHPEWALSIPGRRPVRSRHQLVLDFSREEVRNYIFDAVSGVLDSANIEYVKWDMNRSLAETYSRGLPSERQGEVSHRYVLGLYDLLEKFAGRYPHILFEGCSGGGGRFDAGMLYYTPQIWCSDNTDAIERIKIQYGTSFGYPASAVGSHVSVCPNHQTGRITPFQTRGIAAMTGAFGYELDIGRLPEAEKKLAVQQIKAYKEYAGLIQKGNYYRLTDPYNKPCAAWEFAAEDRSEALICCVMTGLCANPAPVFIKAKGLDEERRYCVNGGTPCPGSALMYGGLLLPVPEEEYASFLFHIKEPACHA